VSWPPTRKGWGLSRVGDAGTWRPGERPVPPAPLPGSPNLTGRDREPPGPPEPNHQDRDRTDRTAGPSAGPGRGGRAGWAPGRLLTGHRRQVSPDRPDRQLDHRTAGPDTGQGGQGRSASGPGDSVGFAFDISLTPAPCQGGTLIVYRLVLTPQ
jgi:hypothetical protein